MAEEPNAIGGRTPGPGAPRGGAVSAAAASRIRVDTSDVTKLKTVIKQTQTEAKSLSDTLAAFDSKVLPTIRKVRAELEGLRRALGTSGTRGATGPKATPIGGGVGAANGNAGQMSGEATWAGRGSASYIPRPGASYDAVLIGGGGARRSQSDDDDVSVSSAFSQPYNRGGRFRRTASYLFTPAPSGTPSTTRGGIQPPAFTTTPAFRGGIAALGAASSIGAFASTHMAAATNRSYLLNTTQLLTGGSTSGGAQQSLNRRLTSGMGNSGLDYTDVTNALGTLMGTGVVGGSYGASRMASVGFLSNINPMQGNAVSAQQVAQTFTSQNYYRMRLAGVNASIASGQNIQQLFDQIINRVERATGRPLTSEEIQSGLQQGTHLNADLTAMGLSADMVQQIVQYWAARRATGKTGVAAVRGAGAQNNLAYARQRAGAAQSRAGEKVDAGFIPGATAGARALGHEYNALGAAADTGVGQAATYAAGALSDFSGQLKKATSVIKTIVEWEIGRALLGGGRGVLGSVLGRLGGSAAMGGLGAGAAAAAPYVGIAAAGAAAGFGTYEMLHHNVLGTGTAVSKATQYVVEDPMSWFGKGPRASHSWHDITHGHGGGTAQLVYDPKVFADELPDWVFGKTGYFTPDHQFHNWGQPDPQLKGKQAAAFQRMKTSNTQTGDSGQAPSIWSGTGQTYRTLEQMASKGPHEIVTSTTSGHHAQNSYHYKGQAIDLADKAGSVDSPGLLAINRYLAKNYGHKLAELIYAGPGGINIKNGKVVNGMAFYGAATMAGHHNHVHVAATPGSLGMAGGVDTGAGEAGNGASAPAAASSGGFASPASSANMLASIFSTSSADVLLAALSGSMPGGMAGTPATSRAGGAASRTAASAAISVGAAPRTVSGAVAQGRRMAAQRGWVGKEWDALYWLWNQESGWDASSHNSAGAYGIPQALPGSKMASAGADWRTNPTTQIKWGLDYISGRYHDPLGAVAHKHATRGQYGNAEGWYDKGAWNIVKDELAQLHQGEMVIPAQTAAHVRRLIEDPHTSTATATSKSRVVPVTLVFQVQNGGEAEARQHANQFARYVAEEHGIEMVAST